MRTILTALLFTTGALANTIGTVTLDTSGLVGNAAGPFTIEFQLVDGNGAGGNNNQVMLTNFDFGGGSADLANPVFLLNGVQTTASSVTLTDADFFNDVQFVLTPGTLLKFSVDAAINPDAIAPDAFLFDILDGSGNPIPTTDATGLNSFFQVDGAGPGTDPAVTQSGADPNQTSISVGAPAFVPTVPEPSAAMLAIGGLAVAVGLGTRGKARSATR